MCFRFGENDVSVDETKEFSCFCLCVNRRFEQSLPLFFPFPFLRIVR